jgi:AraC family transcriptional regulator
MAGTVKVGGGRLAYRHPMTTGDHHARIARATAYLERHLDEELDASSLAKVACLSEFHFHRVFRAVVGESVMSHVRRLRLERAARALGAKDQLVQEVAHSAGFQSHEAFTRAFVAHFGVSPSAWRRDQQQRQTSRIEPVPDDFAQLVQQPELELLALRHVGAYGQVGETWTRLYSLVQQGAPVGLCYDDPEVTDPARFRYDACLLVPGPVPPAGELRRLRLPAGTFATTRHEGPLDTLSHTYSQLVAWAYARGLPLDEGPSVERYEGDRTCIALRVSP